jgi:membrane protease YdiL (CAAX protease family)
VSLALGKDGIAEWWRRLTTVRTNPGWWLVAAIVPVVLMVVAVMVNAAFGAPLPTREQLGGWSGPMSDFLGMLIFVGIGEEAGWMAFAAPRLLARHRFLTAFAAMAAIRVFWHLPLMLSGQLPLVVGIVANAGFQFLVLWVFVRSGGVWWLAAIWHTVHNIVGGQFLYRMVDGADQARLGIMLSVVYWAAAGVVWLVDRKRLDHDAVPGRAAVPGVPLEPVAPRR